MVKIALIADIHSNLEALTAVLADIDKHGIKDIISLGDNIGYGPDPIETILTLYKHNIFSLQGNHDFAVFTPKIFDEASEIALKALEWTRECLCQSLEQEPKFEKILSMYLETPDSFLLEDDSRVILVHGSPGKYKQRFDYILSPEDLLQPAKFMNKRNLKICFFGHTHRQVLWEVDKEGVSLLDYEIDEPVIFTEKELKHAKLIVNPGSVGQPRDQIPESAYLIYEQKGNAHIFTFKRVAYDIEKTVQKIYDIEELDNRLGDRLLIGA